MIIISVHSQGAWILKGREGKSKVMGRDNGGIQGA